MQALKRLEAGSSAPDLRREIGISTAPFYKWRAKFGGMDTSLIAQDERDITIQLACQVSTVSQSCFRYRAKTDDENKRIADWLLCLTDSNRNWVFGRC